VQADAILDMRLYQLARLEIEKILAERAEKKKRLKEIETLLAKPKERWKLIREELAALGEKYGDARRTRFAVGNELEYDPEAYIVHEDATVVLTRDGWLKRVREVKDPNAMRLREGDAPMAVLAGATRDRLVLFSTHGTLYVLRVADVPATTGYGEPVQSILKFGDGERVAAVRLVREGRRRRRAGDAPPASRRPRCSSSPRVATVSARRPTCRRRRAPAAGSRASGRAMRSCSVEPVTGPVVVGRLGAGQDAALPLDDVAELSGPGRGVYLMKPSGEKDDRIVGALALPKDGAFLAVTPEGGERKLVPSDVPDGRRAGKGQKVVKRGGVAALKRPDEVA
jgi:DNA gyrase subunit A